MSFLSLRRVRALFLTMFSFGFCFVLLLNLMIHQLNNSDHEVLGHSRHTNPSAYGMKLRQLSQQHDSNIVMAAAAQLVEGNPQNRVRIQDHIIDSKKISMQKAKNKVMNKNEDTKSPKEKFVFKKPDNFLFPNGRKTRDDDYSYEEDIEKVVIQEEVELDDEKDVYDDDIDPDEDYDEDAADVKAGNVFENLKISPEAVFTKPPLKFQEVAATSAPQSSRVKVKDVNKIPHTLVTEGIYWSPEVEQLIPKGMSNSSVMEWLQLMRRMPVKSLQPPSWDRCGRPKNGFVVMDDGTDMCARYRHPNNNLVLGEVMSFYLSLLLRMDNVPAVLLSHVNNGSQYWHDQDTKRVGWMDNQTVALIQWIDDMTSPGAHVRMPEIILEAYRTGDVVNTDTVMERKLTAAEVSQVVQWGTMVVFDYLTGNYDRVASMQDAAEREKLPKIMQDSIRNLRKSTVTGKLWLIDNESGLLDAYDLLYHSGSNGERFLRFHREMLKTMCIFQRALVDALYKLHGSISPHTVLENFAQMHEPLLDQLMKDSTYNLFITIFSKRLTDVIQWINFCRESHKR